MLKYSLFRYNCYRSTVFAVVSVHGERQPFSKHGPERWQTLFNPNVRYKEQTELCKSFLLPQHTRKSWSMRLVIALYFGFILI